jgi:hypothetical protein
MLKDKEFLTHELEVGSVCMVKYELLLSFYGYYLFEMKIVTKIKKKSKIVDALIFSSITRLSLNFRISEAVWSSVKN